MERNPLVNLRHESLDRNTTQPLSVARHLVKSGWAPADDQSAVHMDLPLVSKKASSKKTSRSSTKADASKSNSTSDASEGKN
jgi:hypothetical protein